MAETVINNPGALRSDEGAAAAGWIVALLIVAGIILAGVYVVPRLQAPTPTTDINVTIPEGTIPGTNNSETNTPGTGGNSGSGSIQ